MDKKSDYFNLISKYCIVAILAVLLLLGTYARFYGLRSHLHFDIDEADHTQIIYNIFHDRHIVLKGPPTSDDSNLYHGAYYYYLYLLKKLFGLESILQITE
jgi:hypothetical protein